MKKFPIGLSNFQEVIQDGYYYIDKSLFIEEIFDISAKSILIPRPRRFGKTLNMSMLHSFLDIKKSDENALLFENLKIRKTKSWEHQGKYPVIYLSFKDVKEITFEKSLQKISNLCSSFIRENFLELIDVSNEAYIDIKFFQRICNKETTEIDLDSFLKTTSRALEKIFNQKVVILIDEYDSCIIKSWQEGYYNEMITFMRNFLSGGFKDNDYLYKGVITGILRVAKESIFSGLNNLRVYSVLSHAFSDKFGLLEGEVKELLCDISQIEEYEKVKEWYNGYLFGKTKVYNPWSIINFADAVDEGVQPYWVNTSANELVEELLTNANADLEKKLTGLIDGQVMESEIAETTIFKDLDQGAEKTVLGLLLFNGYLTIDYAKQEDINYYYGLKIPNKEVSIVYKQMLERLLNKAKNVNSSEILTALLDQDAEAFDYYLSEYLMNAFSYNDFNMKSFPERVYHAFILGLMAHLSSSFVIKSNPETGLGRADLIIYSKDINDRRGWVLEFKSKKPYHKVSLESIAKEAMDQIHDSKYISVLKENNKTELMLVGVAFDGKEVACVIEKS